MVVVVTTAVAVPNLVRHVGDGGLVLQHVLFPFLVMGDLMVVVVMAVVVMVMAAAKGDGGGSDGK